MNSFERRMLELLVRGREKHGIVAVKAEFEAEGTRTDELLRLLEIARRAGVKVGLKIGGCEAIRDLMECKQFGVDYVIAPMVETPYALSKFIAAKDKVFSRDEQTETDFLFNVETITTYGHIDELTRISRSAGVGLVFGRVDFAGSLGHDRSFVNTAEMMAYVGEVAQRAKDNGLDIVVGGGVTSASVEPFRAMRKIRLDRFETRKVIFDGSAVESATIEDALADAIEFELLWLKNKRDYYNIIGAEDQKRIEIMEQRATTKTSSAAA